MTELVRKFLKLHQSQINLRSRYEFPKPTNTKIFFNDYYTMIDLDKKDDDGMSLFLSLMYDSDIKNLKIGLSNSFRLLLVKFDTIEDFDTMLNDFETMDDVSLVLTYGKGILDSNYCFQYEKVEIEPNNPIQKIDFFIEYIDEILKL